MQWPLSERDREQFIEGYIPLVRYIAGRILVALPPTLTYDDLASYGYIGLIEAVDRYDPTRGVKFLSYAVSRIKGSIYDELRSQDWASRKLRSTIKRIDAARDQMSNEFGRDASDHEVAARLGVSVGDVQRALADKQSLVTDQLASSATEEEESSQAPIALSHTDLPDQEAVVGEFRHRVAAALDYLEPQHRTLMALYYFEDLNFTQIAKLLGVTQSRICQIHTQAVNSLRGLLV